MSRSQPRGHPSTVSPSDTESPGEATEQLPPDEIFHLLQTNRRRDALRYLNEHENPVRMRDLAEQVAAWENDTTVAALSSTQRQRVYIPLYQTHLPKLDEAGVIEYDQSRGIVERTPKADQLDPFLEGTTEVGDRATEPAAVDDAAASSDHDWSSYYTVATVVGIALLGGTVLGLPLFSRLSGLLLGAIVSVMFGLLTLARYVESSSA